MGKREVTILIVKGDNVIMQNRQHKLKLVVSVGVAAGALLLGLVIPTVSEASSTSTATNTITLAEGAGANPDYIFPYAGCKYFSSANIAGFQQLMYRPLYFFGLGSSAAVQPTISLGDMPAFSNGNKTITITMKGWKFASGQTVDAQSVMFFLNMYKADPSSYCGYNQGFGIPDQLASATGTGNTVTLNFSKSVNPNWILYNYLSEITPMPDTWDVTAAGTSSTCATGTYGAAATDTACKAVEAYLDAQSGETSTFADTMWQSGDSGPWTLTAFDNLGNATFVPNPTYSGPQKAQVSFVKEVAFTTTEAEQNELRAGTVDIGYIDNSVLTANGTPSKPGANWPAIASNFNIEMVAPWSVDYAAYNFNPKNPQAPLLNQLYIRQALQSTVNQTGMINKIFKGYGYPQINPMPSVTPTAISGGASTKNPYSYNPRKALKLLTSHGWVNKGGTLLCEKPGTGAKECGKAIRKGKPLTVSLLYGSGVPILAVQVNTEVSEWKSIGIDIKVITEPFNQVVGICTARTSFWSICLWGAGWTYAPDYYPSGESLFVPGASFNIGDYSNAALTASVKASTFGTASLKSFANIAAVQLPDLYQPATTNDYIGGGIGEIVKTLKSSIGFSPSPLQAFTPEYYHY